MVAFHEGRNYARYPGHGVLGVETFLLRRNIWSVFQDSGFLASTHFSVRYLDRRWVPGVSIGRNDVEVLLHMLMIRSRFCVNYKCLASPSSIARMQYLILIAYREAQLAICLPQHGSHSSFQRLPQAW